MSLNPKIWGKHGWIFFDSTILAYPSCPSNQDKKNMKNFLIFFKEILPCFTCRGNCRDHYKKFPVTDKVLSSRDNLIKWNINIHNEVNKITGSKPTTYNEFINKYTKMYNSNYSNQYLFIVLFVLILLILLSVILRRYNSSNS